MAETKRKFYGSGDAKGFTRKDFFKAVESMANGEDVSLETMKLIADAATYELEGINLKSSKNAEGEKKDPLQSDYAVALTKAILPLLKNDEAFSAQELQTMATSKGMLAPSGKAFVVPWIARVLNAMENKGIVKTSKIVEKTNNKGLKAQDQVDAYKLG